MLSISFTGISGTVELLITVFNDCSNDTTNVLNDTTNAIFFFISDS